MGDDDEPVVHRAKLEDEFLKHPGSGALIRNPFRETGRTLPIILSRGDYEHNSLDETLHDWQTVTVSEAGFRDMLNHQSQKHCGTTILPSAVDIEKANKSGRSWKSPAIWFNTQQRAAVGKLRDLSDGVEFSVSLRKSTYAAPRVEGRKRPNAGGHHTVTHIDKVAIEVSDDRDAHLRIEAVNEGLVTVWNRTHHSFLVKADDLIVKVNDKCTPSCMLEELTGHNDLLRLTVRRTTAAKASSKDPVRKSMFQGGKKTGLLEPIGIVPS